MTAGRLRARLVGKTWVTTRAEVERYRKESVGQAGRPERVEASLLAELEWPDSHVGGQLHILGFTDTPTDHVHRVVLSAQAAISRGAWTVAEVLAALRADPRSQDVYVVSGGPRSIALPRFSRGDGTNLLEPKSAPYEDVLGKPGAPNILEQKR